QERGLCGFPAEPARAEAAGDAVSVGVLRIGVTAQGGLWHRLQQPETDEGGRDARRKPDLGMERAERQPFDAPARTPEPPRRAVRITAGHLLPAQDDRPFGT